MTNAAPADTEVREDAAAKTAPGPPRYRVGELYRAILVGHGEEERRLLAHIKRLFERYRADARFRDALSAADTDRRALAAGYGIAIDPAELGPLLAAGAESQTREELDRWPLLRLWHARAVDLERLVAAFRAAGDGSGANPRFDAWRQRQIRRTKGELGAVANSIAHAVLSFELSAGCSIGCWFCGVSAERFRGNFAYDRENARLWRGILEEAVGLFGTAAQTGFCYWGTDPADNPDYPSFIEDFHRVTGALPQTTTAAPLRDLALTRRILRLHDRYGAMPDRFSIVNLKTFEGVHATFSAEELAGVELVLQNPGSMSRKTAAGRARNHPQKLTRAAAGFEPLDSATIACVSGFLVNMVEGTIRLISPTRASVRWPLGYRTYGERRFATAAEFRRAVAALIDEHMPDNIPANRTLRFRDDLAYRREPEGFTVECRGGRFGLTGFAGAGALGDLLHQGSRSGSEMAAALIAAGLDPFVSANLLQQLFDRGLLEGDGAAADLPTRETSSI